MNKYHNHKITAEGETFDSRDEYQYYLYLLKLKAEGKILNFERQPTYELQPKFKKNGKTYRAITYTPDFLVYWNNGDETLVDVKSLGTATQQGELRRKLFEYKYPNISLIWLCRSIKYGDSDGWIEYEELKKIYARRKI